MELPDKNKRQLFISHGFVTLNDEVKFLYKTDNYYDHESDRSIRFDDPKIGVNWGIENPVPSDKDKNAPLLKDSDCSFTYDK